MPCNECGHAVELVSSDGGIAEGTFTEKYECVQGHIGFVSGEASGPAHKWTRSGLVFEE